MDKGLKKYLRRNLVKFQTSASVTILFERIVTSVANCEEPLYAIIMPRKSFRINPHSIVSLNAKEILAEPIRNNQVIRKSFTNMPKPWLIHKVNLQILLKP